MIASAKEPTDTFRIVEVLRKQDDLLTSTMIRALDPAIGPSIATCLAFLKKKGVVDFVEAENRLWWFLTGEDTRIRVHTEMAPKDGPIRRRRLAQLK